MKIVKPSTSERETPRGVVGGAEISQATTGAHNIYMGVFRVPPGARSRPHYHELCESAVYLLSGALEVRWGDHLEEVVELEPGAVAEEHSHEHEQLGLVLRGSLRFRVGSEERELRAGQTWEIPSNTPHRAEAGPDGATVLDLFAPPRSEWRGRDLLLRGSSACARRYAGASFAETWESVWQAKASRLMLKAELTIHLAGVAATR